MKISKSILGAIILTLSFGCSSEPSTLKTADTTETKEVIQHVDTSLNGSYTGVEYDDTLTDPAYPEKLLKAYHLSRLKIVGDSVFLDQNPIYVHNKDTIYSASDGGFFYWSGKVSKQDSIVKLKFTELFCDMCGELVEKNAEGKYVRVYRTKEWTATPNDKGFIIDGYLFARTPETRNLISEHPEPYLKRH